MTRSRGITWMALLMTALLGIAYSSVAHAYNIRCDGGQNWCYVKTKRMVPGDWVGIFDRSSRLVAIGKIEEIVGDMRKIRIVKRYRSITKNSGLKRIRDEVLDNPGSYYTIYRGPAQMVGGAQVGVASIGLGKGLAGFGVDGFLDYRLMPYLYATGRLFFAYGTAKRLSKAANLWRGISRCSSTAASAALRASLSPSPICTCGANSPSVLRGLAVVPRMG